MQKDFFSKSNDLLRAYLKIEARKMVFNGFSELKDTEIDSYLLEGRQKKDYKHAVEKLGRNSLILAARNAGVSKDSLKKC